MQQAIFAAGCFWGVQYYLDQVPGIVKTTVGYTGGSTINPTYQEVCTHTTGHAEAVLVDFDSNIIEYEDLCRQFFKLHNPTQLNYQGPDYGDSYRSAVFYLSDLQRQKAEQVSEEVQKEWKEPVVTEITAAGPFYVAEEYHQKYAEKTGRGMCHVPYSPLNK